MQSGAHNQVKTPKKQRLNCETCTNDRNRMGFIRKHKNVYSRQTNVWAQKKSIWRVQTLFSQVLGPPNVCMHKKNFHFRLIYVNWNMQFSFPYLWGSFAYYFIWHRNFMKFWEQVEGRTNYDDFVPFGRPSLKLHPDWVECMCNECQYEMARNPWWLVATGYRFVGCSNCYCYCCCTVLNDNVDCDKKKTNKHKRINMDGWRCGRMV